MFLILIVFQSCYSLRFISLTSWQFTALSQWFSREGRGGNFAPPLNSRGHLAMSGDNFGCNPGDKRATVI